MILGNPTTDPDGRDIPPPSEAVKEKLNESRQFFLASELKNGQHGYISIILAKEADSEILMDLIKKMPRLKEMRMAIYS